MTQARLLYVARNVKITAVFLSLILAGFGVAHADGLSTLDKYLRTTRSGSASFTQTVTNVNKPGTSKTSSGRFAFNRPRQFRFDYEKPFSQAIVADGKTLWMFDADLNQVSQRPQAAALNATPAALVASSTSIQSLQKQFKLENAPSRDGLEWVKATPLQSETQIKDIMIGFDSIQLQLRRLEILDSFGQRSVMEFGAFSTASKTSFHFKPPTGADVLQQ